MTGDVRPREFGLLGVSLVFFVSVNSDKLRVELDFVNLERYWLVDVRNILGGLAFARGRGSAENIWSVSYLVGVEASPSDTEYGEGEDDKVSIVTLDNVCGGEQLGRVHS